MGAAVHRRERSVVVLDAEDSRAYRAYLRARLNREEMSIPEGVLAARKLAILTAGVGEIVEMHVFETDEARAGTRCVEIYVGRPTGVVRWDQSGPQVEVAQEKRGMRVVLMIVDEGVFAINDAYIDECTSIRSKGGVVLELEARYPTPETSLNHVTLATEVYVWCEEREADLLALFAKEAITDARILGRPVSFLPRVLGT